MDGFRRAATGAILFLAACSRPAVEEAPTAFGQPDEIERQLPRSAEETWDAVLEVLDENKFQIVQQDHDKLGGDLSAGRSPGSKVHVRVKQLQLKRTSLSVRLEPPDRSLSVQIHEAVARVVGLGEATGGLFGGESEQGAYALALEQAVQVARRALAALNLHLIDLTTKATEAELKGRRVDSTPVKIRMKAAEPRRTEVTFLVGTSKSDDHKDLLKSLRQEFERRARQLAP